ncbi:hypothetical protein [uncultured Gemella sp.]|uniref:hypothetical protein n=1 Tax=uncultured Gemella sp. TaxID=254352 RepID=UPI0028D229AD|nr:hypothetical protein [uncultured Gemella sp.]
MDIAARIGNHSSVSWKRICDNNLKKNWIDARLLMCLEKHLRNKYENKKTLII